MNLFKRFHPFHFISLYIYLGWSEWFGCCCCGYCCCCGDRSLALYVFVCMALSYGIYGGNDNDDDDDDGKQRMVWTLRISLDPQRHVVVAIKMPIRGRCSIALYTFVYTFEDTWRDFCKRTFIIRNARNTNIYLLTFKRLPQNDSIYLISLTFGYTVQSRYKRRFGCLGRCVNRAVAKNQSTRQRTLIIIILFVYCLVSELIWIGILEAADSIEWSALWHMFETTLISGTKNAIHYDQRPDKEYWCRCLVSQIPLIKFKKKNSQ